jgi:RNase P/RNase MRP subunit POP5
MPRPRYIAFHLAGSPLTRRAVANAIRARARQDAWRDADAPQLTRYAWPHGIVRVEHLHATRARRLLEAITAAAEGDRKIAVTIATLGTSGTLKALTGRLGVLTRRDAPAPKA